MALKVYFVNQMLFSEFVYIHHYYIQKEEGGIRQ